MLLPEWSTTVFFFVIVVHESLVCPEQLNVLLFFRKILNFPQILWFSCIVVYLKPFQQWLYAFEIHPFTPRSTEGLICNYYSRFKRSLMLQKEKTCIFFIYYCPSETTRDSYMFPRRQNKLNLPWSSILLCFEYDKNVYLIWCFPEYMVHF